MSRATDSLLDQLHSLQAEVLIDQLERAIAISAANPDDPELAVSPALLSAVTRFLVSNNITAPASSPRVENLSAKLADIGVDLDDEVLGGSHRH
jgi:hypothetical protein